MGDVLEAYESNAVAGMYHAVDWDTRILVGFDRDFIFTMVEVLFGSDGSEPPVNEERAFSNIEMRVAQSLFEEAGKALQAAFAPVSRTSLKLERVETRMDFAIIGRRNNQAVVAKILIMALGLKRDDDADSLIDKRAPIIMVDKAADDKLRRNLVGVRRQVR